jgi:hypothetical protein
MSSYVPSEKIAYLDDRPHINMMVGDSQGKMQSLTVLVDNGNDITLLTRSAAQQLGIDPMNTGEKFDVSGITDLGQNFGKITNTIQIGNLPPIQIRMGLAWEDAGLAENLLGRLDVIENGPYTLTLDGQSATFTINHPDISINTGNEYVGSGVSSYTLTNLRHPFAHLM